MERQTLHESTLKDKETTANVSRQVMANQVQSISRDTGEIKTAVAVMRRTFEMSKEESERTRKETKEIQASLRREINLIKREGFHAPQ